MDMTLVELGKWALILFVYIPSGLLLVSAIVMIYIGDTNKKCSWCDSKKIKFISGKEFGVHWKHSKKGGSKDQRFKNNYQLTYYSSIFKCEECNAQTTFYHVASRRPGPRTEVYARRLLSNGSGERTGTDY